MASVALTPSDRSGMTWPVWKYFKRSPFLGLNWILNRRFKETIQNNAEFKLHPSSHRRRHDPKHVENFLRQS